MNFLCFANLTFQSKFSALLANGFLPTRASWMLDFIATAMIVVIAALSISIFQVRVRRNFVKHRNLQIATAALLALTLVAFEIDIRFFTDWRELAKPSSYYASGWVDRVLAIHLCFAIPTPIVWGLLIWVSLRRFRTGFDQGDFNRFHRVCGRIGAAMMYTTALTGWTFYYVAFVA